MKKLLVRPEFIADTQKILIRQLPSPVIGVTDALQKLTRKFIARNQVVYETALHLAQTVQSLTRRTPTHQIFFDSINESDIVKACLILLKLITSQ